MRRGKLVVGNWKMNGGLASNAALLVALLAGWQPRADRAMAVCVPFPYLGQARDALLGSTVDWGAQDVSEHAAGAFTGEVAASMIASSPTRPAALRITPASASPKSAALFLTPGRPKRSTHLHSDSKANRESHSIRTVNTHYE